MARLLDAYPSAGYASCMSTKRGRPTQLTADRPKADDIIKIRTAADLSQDESAALAQVSRRTWQRYEAGTSGMPIALFKMWKAAVNDRSKKPVASPTIKDIRRQRELRKLTRAGAAIIAHVGIDAWKDWESGRRRMHPSRWQRWLREADIMVTRGFQKDAR